MNASRDNERDSGPEEPQGCRFTLGTLFLLTTVFALSAAAIGLAVRYEALGAGNIKLVIYALPVGGVIVASVLRGVMVWMARRR